MALVTDDDFILIDNQVAMPEDTLCALLNVTPARIAELVKFVGMKYERGGVYFRDGKYYFASPEVVLKMQALNGYSTKHKQVSPDVVYGLFAAADKRLLLRISDKTLKNFATVGLALMVIVAFLILPTNDSSPSKSTSPPTIEQTSKRLKETFYSLSYNALEKVTGLRVTEKWMTSFNVREDSDEEITTYGYVEFENDGVKRPFWITFKKSTKKVLRVDIDTSVVYVADDW